MRNKILVHLLFLLIVAGCRNTPAAGPMPATPTAPPPLTPTIVIPTVPPTDSAIETPGSAPTDVTVVPPGEDLDLIDRPRFATFDKPAVGVSPAIFHDPIAADLSNVVVPFVLSEAQRARLAETGIVVSPGMQKEFFTVYEQTRYHNVPAFVSSDSLLHVYHLLFDKVLRTAERDAFIPLLRELNDTMLAQTDVQYQALQGTEWEDAALRSVAFSDVGSRLIEPDVTVPGYAEELVQAELALIEETAGIQPSPLFPGLAFGEDYTQYIARGHYSTSEALTRYFKSMMWYGRMTFRLKTEDPEVGKAETRSALLLVHALRTAQLNGEPALNAWLELYNPTVFFVVRSDDLTAFQYLEVIEEVYGPADDRLTDEKWREMLDEGDAPARPEWTSRYLTQETEQATFQEVIYQLQSTLSYAYWTLGEYGSLYPAAEEVEAQFSNLAQYSRRCAPSSSSSAGSGSTPVTIPSTFRPKTPSSSPCAKRGRIACTSLMKRRATPSRYAIPSPAAVLTR